MDPEHDNSPEDEYWPDCDHEWHIYHQDDSHSYAKCMICHLSTSWPNTRGENARATNPPKHNP